MRQLENISKMEIYFDMQFIIILQHLKIFPIFLNVSCYQIIGFVIFYLKN